VRKKRGKRAPGSWGTPSGTVRDRKQATSLGDGRTPLVEMPSGTLSGGRGEGMGGAVSASKGGKGCRLPKRGQKRKQTLQGKKGSIGADTAKTKRGKQTQNVTGRGNRRKNKGRIYERPGKKRKMCVESCMLTLKTKVGGGKIARKRPGGGEMFPWGLQPHFEGDNGESGSREQKKKKEPRKGDRSKKNEKKKTGKKKTTGRQSPKVQPCSELVTGWRKNGLD